MEPVTVKEAEPHCDVGTVCPEGVVPVHPDTEALQDQLAVTAWPGV
jgi:hypothetical protein